MPVNADKPHRWKADVNRSVDFYNDWFMSFAPEAYREQRVKQARIVEREMERTDYLRDISPALLKEHPSVLPLLRAATAPPIARDRLAGLAYVDRYLMGSMEETKKHAPRVPPRMPEDEAMEQLERISNVLEELLDQDLCTWKDTEQEPEEEDIHRASLVLADRLCGAAADPIIRNAQEKRQKKALREWLERRGYQHVTSASISKIEQMEPGTFTFGYAVPVTTETRSGKPKQVNITVDGLIMPQEADPGSLPLIVEAKSAGDFANPNKRRKEEAQKAHQLRAEYGSDIQLLLFLCGYFDSGYLGYEAAEGIDWVWEHRINDLAALLNGGSSGDDTLPDGYGDAGDGNGAPAVAEPAPGFAGKEAERLKLQHRLDAQKTQQERNRLGQFATPTALAEEIVRYAETLLPAGENIDFLEPAFGTGSFFSAFRCVFPKERIRRARGFEVDAHYAGPAAALWKETELDVTAADFTAADPSLEPPFDLLITNPPYTRHHHLQRADKHRMQQRAEQLVGIKPSGLSGLYAYFLYLSHPWLREGGIGGWLVPSNFMYVNYGRQLRAYLLNQVTLLHVHQFAPEEVQFDDALVSSTVLWLKKEKPPSNHEVLFSRGGTLREPDRAQCVPVSQLREMRKWRRLFAEPAAQTETASGVRLGELFTIKRGLATGANKFFIMTPEEAAERALPAEFLIPILPSPRYLPEDVIDAAPNGMPVIERRHLLLDCSLPEEQVEAEHPTLWAYLQEGAEKGIRERYLCSRRSPWYAQEERAPAPLVCPYMGRVTSEKKHPFRFILNRSKAVVANVYLNLYPQPAMQRALGENPELIHVVWEALKSVKAETLISNGRTYGGGLHKLEPKELANVPVRDLPADVLKQHSVQGSLFQ